MNRLLAILLFLTGQSAQAIIVFREDGRNLTPPADPTAAALWAAQGSWQGATGVAVSAHWFITAMHLGGSVGRFYDQGGKCYQVVQAAEIPHTDLALMRVDGTLPNWVELWDETGGTELKHEALLMGRGAARGQEILLADGFKPGWSWGDSDGKLSWGTNEIVEFFDAGPELGSLLVWSWDQGLGPDEGTLAAGDSGGGLFLKDAAGHWRLAGIQFDVDPSMGGKDTQYSRTADGKDPFWAAIHDGHHLWRGVLGEPYRSAAPLDDHPAPMWAGASRIAPHAELIRRIISPGSQVANDYPPRIIWSPRKLLALGGGLGGLSLLGLAWRFCGKRAHR